jgi:transcriptional regulator with XRE-family HTH domain
VVVDNELGMFLRSRRETITPAQPGRPPGSRPRTPGLLPSEVATLAGLGVEHVTRLEQGLDPHPSAPVLARLAAALGLSASERAHLYRLSAGPVTHHRRADVRDAVRAILHQLEPTAAVVIGPHGDLLAWTDGFGWLAEASGLLDGDPPNLNRYVFTDRRARTTFPDWDRAADERAADLLGGRFPDDPGRAALGDELTVTAGETFDRRVRDRPAPAPHGIRRWNHPRAGELRMAYETMDLPADDGQRLILYLPADPATEAAVTARRPASLRLVAG